MRLKKLFLFLVFVCSGLIVEAQTVDEVIEGYIKFIGGRKSWAKIKTMVTSGEYNYGGVAFPFTATAKAPNRYKFVVPYNGKYYAQAFDGVKGWKIDAFKNETQPTQLEGKPALAMANEANVELQDALIDYRQKGHQAVLEASDTVAGKRCYVVSFIRSNGEKETYYLDTKTYALVMKKAISKNAEMEGALLQIYYTDYHSVKGIKIPFKATCKANDQTILTITTQKAQLNKDVADGEFQP